MWSTAAQSRRSFCIGMARRVDTAPDKIRRRLAVTETSPDQIVARFLFERAQSHGMEASHDTALLILAGVINFIVSTKGDNVARGAVSEIAAGLELALAFKNIELIGVRQ